MKCPHPWYFSYKPRGGVRYRFSLDVELGRHVGSKIEAEKAANDIRTAIHAGTFRRATAGQPAIISATPAPVLPPLDRVAALFLERSVQASGKITWANDGSMLTRLCEAIASDGRRLGDWPITSITVDELEAFYAGLHTAGLAASTRNGYVQVLKALFRWAAAKGYLDRSPLTVAAEKGELLIKRSKVAQRRRRLTAAEESALLAAAGSASHDAGFRLQWLIVAALETGCRRGELLALRWADVQIEKRSLLVRAVEEGAKKTGRSRSIPMSTRLKAIVEMAQTDAKAHGVDKPEHYVFGSAIGGKIGSVKRAWETAVLKAYQRKPEWAHGRLSADSRKQLEVIDLHFHDLRHEAGCRWIEGGIPLHHVQELLGHASLAQTNTYLHASEFGLADSMKRFDDLRGKPVANETAIDHPLVSHAEETDADKSRLH